METFLGFDWHASIRHWYSFVGDLAMSLRDDIDKTLRLSQELKQAKREKEIAEYKEKELVGPWPEMKVVTRHEEKKVCVFHGSYYTHSCHQCSEDRQEQLRYAQR